MAPEVQTFLSVGSLTMNLCLKDKSYILPMPLITQSSWIRIQYGSGSMTLMVRYGTGIGTKFCILQYTIQSTGTWYLVPFFKSGCNKYRKSPTWHGTVTRQSSHLYSTTLLVHFLWFCPFCSPYSNHGLFKQTRSRKFSYISGSNTCFL